MYHQRCGTDQPVNQRGLYFVTAAFTIDGTQVISHYCSIACADNTVDHVPIIYSAKKLLQWS